MLPGDESFSIIIRLLLLLLNVGEFVEPMLMPDDVYCLDGFSTH